MTTGSDAIETSASSPTTAASRPAGALLSAKPRRRPIPRPLYPSQSREPRRDPARRVRRIRATSPTVPRPSFAPPHRHQACAAGTGRRADSRRWSDRRRQCFPPTRCPSRSGHLCAGGSRRSRRSARSATRRRRAELPGGRRLRRPAHLCRPSSRRRKPAATGGVLLLMHQTEPRLGEHGSAAPLPVAHPLRGCVGGAPAAARPRLPIDRADRHAGAGPIRSPARRSRPRRLPVRR